MKQQCGMFGRVVAACVRSWENVYRLGCASNMALTQLSHCGPRGKDLRSIVTPFWLTTIIFAQMTIKSIYKADSEAILSLELPGNQELGQGSGQVGGSLGRPSIALWGHISKCWHSGWEFWLTNVAQPNSGSFWHHTALWTSREACKAHTAVGASTVGTAISLKTGPWLTQQWNVIHSSGYFCPLLFHLKLYYWTILCF